MLLHALSDITFASQARGIPRPAAVIARGRSCTAHIKAGTSTSIHPVQHPGRNGGRERVGGFSFIEIFDSEQSWKRCKLMYKTWRRRGRRRRRTCSVGLGTFWTGSAYRGCRHARAGLSSQTARRGNGRTTAGSTTASTLRGATSRSRVRQVGDAENAEDAACRDTLESHDNAHVQLRFTANHSQGTARFERVHNAAGRELA